MFWPKSKIQPRQILDNYNFTFDLESNENHAFFFSAIPHVKLEFPFFLICRFNALATQNSLKFKFAMMISGSPKGNSYLEVKYIKNA